MRFNQNYLPETLFNAYKKATRQNDMVTMMMPPDTCDIEIEAAGVDMDSAVQEVFSLLHIVDSMVQENNREYAVAGLTLYPNQVEILYYGVSENTQFDVLVFKENEQWYCANIGLKRFVPPLIIEGD